VNIFLMLRNGILLLFGLFINKKIYCFMEVNLSIYYILMVFTGRLKFLNIGVS